MAVQTSSPQQRKVLDEIIDNARDLPLESQVWVLMMAKAMCHTRNCVVKQDKVESNHKPPKHIS